MNKITQAFAFLLVCCLGSVTLMAQYNGADNVLREGYSNEPVTTVVSKAEASSHFKLVRSIEGQDGKLQWVSFSHDGKHVAACGDKFVTMFEVNSGKLVRRYEGSTQDVKRFAISPNGKWIAGGSRDTNIYIWDMESAKLVKVLRGHKEQLIGVQFSPDSKWLVSSHESVHVWDCETWASSEFSDS